MSATVKFVQEAAAAGWLSFEEYADIVQHHPVHGYYGGGRFLRRDFITAPMLSPLFAEAMARQLRQILSRTGGGILELGGGDGTLAGQLLIHCAGAPYQILETSPALRAHQQRTLPAEKVAWVDTFPDRLRGVVIANETLDSVPPRLFAKRGGKWHERGVVFAGGQLRFCERAVPAADELSPRLSRLAVGDDYETEMSPRAEALVRTAAGKLQDGVLLFSDYGFGAREYYHPQRAMGTLSCHRLQKTDSRPLHHAGDKDITVHVDFSAAAAAAADAGGSLIGYTTQAHFLINCGVLEILRRYLGDEVQYARLAAGAQKLLAPHEMGELFKFIAVGKGRFGEEKTDARDDDSSLIGFRQGDMRHRL